MKYRDANETSLEKTHPTSGLLQKNDNKSAKHAGISGTD